MRHKAAFLLAALGLAVLAVHCGSEGDNVFRDGEALCERLYPGQCGTPCTADEACATGLHCAGGACTAFCSPASACANGLLCSERGRCEPAGLTPFPPSDSGPRDGSGGQGDACIDLSVDLAKVVPTVYLLIDQSSTMNDAFGSAGTRWNVVRDVLMNPDGGIVTTLQGDVSFGLALYTARVGETSCPRLIQSTVGLNNRDAIAQIYGSAVPGGGTPTGDAIDRLVGRDSGTFADGGFARLTTPGPKIIVLATDGLPDTCESSDDGTAKSKGEAIAAAQAAYDAGIKTFVVAVGPAITVEHQKEMANAGAGQPLDGGDAAPFSTNNRAEFVSAINTIIYGVRSCVFTLGGNVASGKESSGTVTLDGTPLGYDDPNGWRLSSPTELELLGTACDRLKSASGNLAVRFPCNSFNPAPK